MHAAHHRDDVLDVVGLPQAVVAHAAARREVHLVVLQVEAGVAEEMVVAAVVVMHVRDDHVLDGLDRKSTRLNSSHRT